MKQILSHIVLIQLAISGHALVFAQTDPDTVSSNEIEQALQKSKTRAIGVRAKPKVDLNIPFEINSSSLRPDAKAQLEQLEAALQKDSLAIYRFQIAGHTDASGSRRDSKTLFGDSWDRPGSPGSRW